MPVFRFNEGDMEVPKGWEDKTVNGLSFPVGSKQPSASFTITRDTLKGGQTLAEYVDKQLVDMAKSCPRFELLKRNDVTVDEESAIQVEFTWKTPDGLIVHQQQTVFPLPSRVVLTLTATAPKDKFKQHAAAFQSFVDTFEFRREE